MIKPNDIYNYWRADDVAECMEGITDELYSTLWNDIVPLQSVDDFRETRESGFEALANYWHLLSESDQALLNELDDYWTFCAGCAPACLLPTEY